MTSPTLLSKDPPLVHAGGEEDGRLGDAHQQVCDRQVDDEHVGGRTQAATPATQSDPEQEVSEVRVHRGGTQLETKLEADTASETSAGPSEGRRSRTAGLW